MLITDDTIERAGRFLWTSGRVLEQRRFVHLFGAQGVQGVSDVEGSEVEHAPDGVLAALRAYQTPDGAYAYGLEPDVRGPLPQPATLRAAMPILAETDALHGPDVARLCDWLASVAGEGGGVPPA
ncbi:hypothetical protein GT354_15415, partial [Streptomyces sp. SID3343]|nr:hypothetical protein [Streptomyces sp. SID3343]